MLSRCNGEDNAKVVPCALGNGNTMRSPTNDVDYAPKEDIARPQEGTAWTANWSIPGEPLLRAANKSKQLNTALSRRIAQRVSPSPPPMSKAVHKNVEETTTRVSTLEQVLSTLSVIDSAYIMWSVPLRLGFFFDPFDEPFHRNNWTLPLTLFTIVDSMGICVRIWALRQELRRELRKLARWVLTIFGRRRIHPRAKHLRNALIAFIIDGDDITRNVFKGRGIRTDGKSPMRSLDGLPGLSHALVNAAPHRLTRLITYTACIPWEFLVIWLGFNFLHIVGTIRYLHASSVLPKQFETIILARYRHFKLIRSLLFSASATIAFLFVTGMYLCHTAASGYMFLAHLECGVRFDRCTKAPLPGSWVLKDNMEHGDMWRKYFRSLYWGCKTVTTLGQGDLVPATRYETLYRILVQFASGLWATAMLTAYSFYFSRKHSTMSTNLTTRLDQTNQFFRTRRLPTELAENVLQYFQYMQRTRSGVEEDSVMVSLPHHYQTQCSNYIKYKCVEQIALFRNHDGAFLRSILCGLQKNYYAPSQVVFYIGDPEEMLIVAAGQITITDSMNVVCTQLVSGHAYADHALLKTHKSAYLLTAATFAEVWFLPRHIFQIALRKHFSRLKCLSILSTLQRKKETRQCVSMPCMYPVTTGPKKTDQSVSNITFAQRHQAEMAVSRAAAWQLPDGAFRRRWNQFSCGALIYLLLEVPYHIAFQRGYGLLNSGHTALTGIIPLELQQANFVCSALVEGFFYIDWCLRAWYFVQGTGNNSNDIGGSTLPTESVDLRVLLNSEHIFRRYQKTDSLLADVLANVPISLVWDVIPKDLIPESTVFIARFARLLRLLRLRKLHSTLRTIMLERGRSPSFRLLIYVVIFCVASTHTAACVFYASGDLTGFRGGLPIGGVSWQSISSASCLEDATVYGNCTWYMHDRSIYGMDSPFLRSFQWSIVLVSTVGYGEIMSFSTRECVIGCIWIFVGANICYFTAAVLSSVISQFNIMDSIRQDRVEAINLTLMGMANVSENTKVMIRAYYDTKWKLTGSAVHDEELMNHLPGSIRTLVRASLYERDLMACHIFSMHSRQSPFLKALAQIVRCEIFLKDVMVVKDGHLATEFFVIQSGEVELLLPPLRAAFSGLEREGGSSLSDFFRRGRLIRLSSGKIPLSARLSTVWASQIRVPSMVNAMATTRIGATLRNSIVVSPRFSVSQVQTADANLMPSLATQLRELPCGDRRIPISILAKHDVFGEESISPAAGRKYQVSVRAVSSVQTAVIRRHEFMSVAENYIKERDALFQHMEAKADEYEGLIKALQWNFIFKAKVARRLGIPDSLYVNGNKRHDNNHWLAVRDPEQPFAIWWHRIIGSILVYNFYMIIFRCAFLPRPSSIVMTWLSGIDLASDALLYLDILLKWRWLGYTEHGRKVLDPAAIRDRYVHGYQKQDCLSMLPTFYVGEDYFLRSLCRFPRLLRSSQLGALLGEIQTQIQERFLRGDTKLSSMFDLFRFVFIFLSTAHYISSLYYLIGRLQLENGWVNRSWISEDALLQQYPQNTAVHYMRAMYWCLSTFTVDCFGDIVARNVPETMFSAFACILGWVFVGQVIGRINLLMITLNKDAKQHEQRREDFDQYAKLRHVPTELRHRAYESLEYKSECLLDLRLGETFCDLPQGLRAHLYDEMFSPIVSTIPEYCDLSRAQLEVITSALYLEIYLHGDVICDRGRIGTKLCILKSGRAEVYSPQTKIVFAAVHTGALFGDCAFFIPGAERLASTRAEHSCQVLQLNRHQWNRIWPTDVRHQVEATLLPAIRDKYIKTSRTYLAITKNFYLKDVKAPPLFCAPEWQRLYAARRRSDAVASRTTDRLSSPSQAKQPADDSVLARVLNFARMPSSQSIRSIAGGSSTSTGRGSDRRRSSVSAYAKRMSQSLDPMGRMKSSKTMVLPMDESGELNTNRPQRPSFRRRLSSLSAMLTTLGIDDRSATTEVMEDMLMSSDGDGPAIHSLPVRPASPLVLASLTSVAECLWKQHEKRLSALRLFAVGCSRALTDIAASDEDHPSRLYSRRASISIVPSARAEAAPCHPRWPRRHSIQVTPQNLNAEYMRLDALESEPLASGSTHSWSEELYRSAVAGKPIGGEGGSQYEWDPRAGACCDLDNSLQVRNTSTHLDQSGSFTAVPTERLPSSTLVPPPAHHPIEPLNEQKKGSKYEIWVPTEQVSAYFQEDSRFRHHWDIIMLLVTVYYVVMMPFRASFLCDRLDNPMDAVLVQTGFALEYVLTDVICVIDFVLHRNYFVYLEAGQEVADRAMIAQHYWEAGTYVVDLLSLLPLELIAVILVNLSPHDGLSFLSPRMWRLISFCRLNRFLRGVHFHALSDRVQHFLLYDVKVSWLWPGLCYLLRLGVDFAIATHWVACVFYGISFLGYEYAASATGYSLHPSWLTEPGMLEFAGCADLEAVQRVPVYVKYLRAYHFSIGAITTVCYGDILPMNAVENLATMLVIFLSVAFFSMLSGGFFKYFERDLGRRADYEEKVSQVGDLLSFHRFPTRTRQQMQSYFALSWRESQGMDEDEMLRGVTTSVRREIAAYVHADLLRHVPLLQSCRDARFTRALLAMLRREVFVRNDVITHAGDRGRSMYIIESGLVSIQRAGPHSLQKGLQAPGEVTPEIVATVASIAFKCTPHSELAKREASLSLSPLPSPSLSPSSSPLRSSSPSARRLYASDSGIHATTQAWSQPTNGGVTNQGEEEVRTQVEPLQGPEPGHELYAMLRKVKGQYDHFGERSLLFATPRTATCVALCASCLHVLTLDKYRELLAEFPAYRCTIEREWGLRRRGTLATDLEAFDPER